MIRQFLSLVVVAFIVAGVSWLLISETERSEAIAKGTSGEPFERGPHGGRMLRDGNFALEMTIFEEGVPPEFHIYSYLGDRPLAPEDVDLIVELHRLGGRVDTFSFKPKDDYLRGDQTVIEPHSFDVRVRAGHDGRASEWGFASYEGRTKITAEAASAGGIKVEKAGPATIREIVELTGIVSFDPNKVARVGARFPGVVQALHKGVGDVVRAGETIAEVNSNQSLSGYAVKSPIAGVVLARPVHVGHITATEATLFEIADLSSVWVELHAFGRDAGRIKIGQRLMVETLDRTVQADTTVDFVSPQAEASSQATTVRAALENKDGRWRPGTFVRGSVKVDEKQVPIAVKSSGLQRFRDFDVVFAQFGELYEVRMLELGRSDGIHFEVISGIDPGQTYVAENSFLVKADIEKSGASHDH